MGGDLGNRQQPLIGRQDYLAAVFGHQLCERDDVALVVPGVENEQDIISTHIELVKLRILLRMRLATVIWQQRAYRRQPAFRLCGAQLGTNIEPAAPRISAGNSLVHRVL